MRFHGVEDSCDMYINYSPNDCCQMDYTVIEFFQRVYNKGMDKYNKRVQQMYQEQHKAEIEEKERKELKRLQTKYGQCSHS